MLPQRALGAMAIAALVGCSGSDDESTQPDAATADDATTGGGPPASAGHDLVYHEGLGLVLLVNAGLGGASSPPSSERSRLWAWDGATWSVLDASGPPVRNLAGVAYDAGRDVLVVHGGGYSAELSYDDTWEWSEGGGWRQLEVPGPGVRDHTQMAYDAARAHIVLFGGQESVTSFPGDTWIWDGVEWDSVATTGPTPRVHHAMHDDPVRAVVVLHGGYDPDAGDRGDTWAWDGATWSELTPERAARTHARMAFDEGLDGLVVVGGASSGDPALVRRDDDWQPLAAAGPAPRYLPGLAYDRRRQRLVLFGGGDPSSSELFADTWEFDGEAWQQRDP
jgi:hypothetical protein